ncbi:MAG: acyltransferase [Cellulomonas sp.]|uniref:acyltransferase family protein n=1 Tax=Cellulomonas sp. TaxID=40001 RepID=UPI001853567F|nr:acyltransferase [Cellulomonas sp.]NMM32333.1 acyltransferase [Cellulomonas sp.]
MTGPTSAVAALREPSAPRSSWWRYGEARLDPRRNSLNILRLVFALMVLVAHGWYMAGEGVGLHIANENLGGWAVFGFFAISGYLITGSRFSKPLGEYLVHRVARIFPAFIVCLVVTAFVFAPVAYLRVHGTLDGLMTTPTTPLNYVIGNATLRMFAFDVAGTPGNVPYPAAWNGSLWTLYYEFLCYVVVAVLGSISVFRRSIWGIATAFVASVAFQVALPVLSPYLQNNGDVGFMAKLLPVFLAGGLMHSLRHRVPLTWPGAVVALSISMLLISQHNRTGPQLSAPLVTYVILWVGAVLPSPELLRRHDISYGIYIYAFPVQQLLAMAGAYRWGLIAYDVAAAIATVPFAAASWLLVERPVMRRARRSTSHRAQVPTREIEHSSVDAGSARVEQVGQRAGEAVA